MTLAERAAADLRLVAQLWPGLAETRIPGTPPPYRPSDLTPELRAYLDHEARIERMERDGIAPGEHPDAVRVEILDLMTSLAADIEDIAGRLGGYSASMPPALSSGLADPRPLLEWSAATLPVCHDPETIWYAGEISRQMVADVGRALGLMHDGQRLGVVCPWCHGGLTGKPSWIVRDLLAGQRCEHGETDRAVCVRCPSLIAIVCESDVPCEPPSKDVGTWRRGRPAWPVHEWDWLAKRVTAAETTGKVNA